jgi:hypothetical protein
VRAHPVLCQNPTHLDPTEPAAFFRVLAAALRDGRMPAGVVSARAAYDRPRRRRDDADEREKARDCRTWGDSAADCGVEGEAASWVADARGTMG